MSDRRAEVEATFEVREHKLVQLVDLAERLDKFVGEDPPESGYSPAHAFAVVMNRGTFDDVLAAFSLLDGWTFKAVELVAE